jgi:hypothetical protein
MKLVVLTFGGRECSLKILFPLILKYKHYIHEFRLYIATTIQTDIDYMENFAKNNADFVKTVYCFIDGKRILDNNIFIWDNAYNSCQEDDTVYIKLDDDIVYFDETLFTDFVQYRIENKNAPILYPVIINNLITSPLLEKYGIYNAPFKSNMLNAWINTYHRIYPHIFQTQQNKQNKQKLKIGDFTKHEEVLCPVAWGNFQYCYELHSQFLNDIFKGNKEKYYIDNIILEYAEPMSINACSWIGEELRKYTNEYGNIYNDENYLSLYLPIWSGKKNEIYGKCVVSHYAYYRQRELGLDNTDILYRYYHTITGE